MSAGEDISAGTPVPRGAIATCGGGRSRRTAHRTSAEQNRRSSVLQLNGRQQEKRRRCRVDFFLKKVLPRVGYGASPRLAW